MSTSQAPSNAGAALGLATTLLLSACASINLGDPPHAFEAGWRGQTVCELLYENAAVRVARCTFPPGVGHERHYHRPHFGYALEGGSMRLDDEDGAREVEIPAGARWSSDEVTVHEALNVGETTTSYLIVEPR